MSPSDVCARCGVTIGPGEYNLRIRPISPGIDVEGPEEEAESWVCRRCASRLFLDDDDEDDVAD